MSFHPLIAQSDELKTRNAMPAGKGVATFAWISLAGLAYGIGVRADSPEENKTTGGTSPLSLEEIIVTGSHIRGAAVSTINVQTLDRVQLEQSGASQMADLVRQIPSNTGTTLYNESGTLSGTAQFSLRGLGYSSTLTLLNGRRAGVSPLSDKSAADFVDINQFPLAMIERIDVLKDGSSAIYGSEAVAGVVNLITRKGFEGLELSGDFSSSTNEAYSINVASGRRFDRGSINFYTTFYDQTGNVRSDFPWLIERVGGNGVPGRSQLLSTTSFPASFQRATFNSAGIAAPVSGALFVADPGCQAAGGIFSINDAGVTDTARCRFDFTDQIGVVPAQQRIQAFFEGDYHLTDNLTYFNESSASRNKNLIFAHGGSFTNGSGANGLVLVPADHPFNFFTADPANPRNLIYVDPANWNNAVNTAVPIVASFRPGGQYVTEDKEQTNTYLRTVNGLDFPLRGSWRGTVSHQYAHAKFVEDFPLAHDAVNISSLLLSGDYNPFASSVLTPDLVSPKDGVSLAGNPGSIIDQVFYTSHAVRRTEQNVVDFSTSGALAQLPTGMVSLAVGGQHRSQSLKFEPDTLAAQGLSTSSGPESGFSGSQNVWAGYVEAIFPIHEIAEIQAAVRHEDYGSETGSTTDPKLTGRLRLLSGMLSLRGSWGTSFQAPTLAQGVTTRALQVLNDRVVLGVNGFSCAATNVGSGTDVIVTGGGLKPQDSTNVNFGIDFQPVQSMTLAADYWRYDYSNLIASGQNAQSIVNGECATGVYTPDPRVTRGSSGILSKITTSFVNVGKVVTDGIDFTARYGLSLNSLGDLSFQADTTYVHKFDSYDGAGAVRNAVGSRNFNSNFAPMPRWRGAARALWSKGMHHLVAGVNYTGGYRNDQSNNAPVGSFNTVDIQYGLDLQTLFDWDSPSTVTVGANNLFDRDPPALVRYNAVGQLITGTVSDIDRPGYDALAGANIQGRAVYIRLKQEF